MMCTTNSGTTNQDVESIQRNCNNSDLDQETVEISAVDIPPPYLHVVDFSHHQLSQRFSNSDLPPSYDNCILEPQPPSYSTIN